MANKRTIEQRIAELQVKQARQLGVARCRALLDTIRGHVTGQDYALAHEQAKTLADELKALGQP